MKAANRVALNTGILYARMGITVFISLYTTRLILASLGVSDFGIFNVVGGAIAMLTFLNTAMAAATQRFMSYAEGSGDADRQKRIFNVSLILHLLIALIILVVLEIVGYILFKGIFKIPLNRLYSAKMIYQFMVISTVFTIISVPYDAVINAHENMLLFAILGVIESVFKLAIAIYITYTLYDKLIVYGLLMAVLSVFLLIIRRVYCHRTYSECKISLKKYYDKTTFKELTSFATWSFLGSSTSILTNYGQGIVMNTFFGTVVNTAQGIANQVSGQLSVFAGTMQKALNPIIDKSEGAGDRSFMLRASMVGSKMAFFLLMFFFIPVLIEMPYIFKIWLKKVPEYAVIFGRLLLARNLIEQLFITLVASISATGNIRKYQIFASLLCLFPLPVSFMLFKMGFPPYAIYIVFIVYSIMASCIILYFAKRICGLSISYFMRHIIVRCVVAFSVVLAVSFLPLFFLHEEGFLRLSLVLAVSSMAFLLAVWTIGFDADDRQRMQQFVRSILSRVMPKSKLA